MPFASGAGEAPDQQRIRIAHPADVEEARRVARDLAIRAGFGTADAGCVAIAVSELGTNLLRYAIDGAVELALVAGSSQVGVEIVSVDSGPGIADIPLALTDGYSTGGGLGSGLPAVRRLMDDFDIQSASDGTRITARKWTSAR